MSLEVQRRAPYLKPLRLLSSKLALALLIALALLLGWRDVALLLIITGAL